jgi:site-specific DNA recombinase
MTDNNKQPKKTLKVAFYLRVSTDEQAERYGIDLQKRALEQTVESRSTKYGDDQPTMVFAGEQYIYKDEGISGTSPIDERPAFLRLKEDILNSPKDRRPFDLVAVYRIDRFARRLKVLLNIVDLFESHDIQFLSVHESIDTSTPFGRAILGIIGVLSELEMETIKQRMQAGRKEAIHRGVFMGSTPPYGYIKDEEGRLVILEPEAKIVRQIFDMLLIERMPIKTICDYLKAHEIESPGISAYTHNKRAGKKWSKKSSLHFWSISMLSKLITDEVYIGRYYFNKNKGNKALPKSKWQLSKHKHTPIITEGEFYRAQQLLEERRTIRVKPRTGAKYTYLLTGLLKCDCCYDPKRDEREGMVAWYGEPKEIGRGTGQYSYYYKCRRKNRSKGTIRCGALPLPADQLEEYVVKRVGQLLSNPEVVYNYQNKLDSAKKVRKLLETDRNQTQEMLNGIPKLIENLKDQHAHSFITIDELEEKLEEAEDKRKQHKQKIKELEAKISSNKLEEGYIRSLEVFDQQYQKALENIENDREQLKQILRIIVDKIVIYSRDLTDKDVVAGRRSKNQKLPYKITISLRLPQEYMQMLGDYLGKYPFVKFGDNLTNLRG